ncbi:MAG: helix-turn-helix domain-containing protein [Clostridiales bacterium]|nr:helix-turn-helix domain-containing protein [Clostridiales bacterium]
MSVSSKIKALINLKGIDHAGLAKRLGISSQALSNKLHRQSFTVADLIKISACLDCDLAFIVDDMQRIYLTEDDIKQSKQS